MRRVLLSCLVMDDGHLDDGHHSLIEGGAQVECPAVLPGDHGGAVV